MAYKYHNFKITAGGPYISKTGHDSAPGTADEPKRTPVSGTGNYNTTRAVIGAGVYDVQGAFYPSNIEADGKVIIRGNNSGPLIPTSFNNSSGDTKICKGIRFENFSGNAGSQFIGSESSDILGNTDNVYVNISGNWEYGINSGRGMTFLRPVFLNCNITTQNPYAGIVVINYGIVINSTIHTRGLRSTYVGKDSLIVITNGGGLPYVLNNCCIQGKVVYNGVTYELKKQKDGTSATGTDPAIPDLVDVFPDIYTTRKCFNQPPKFNDVAGEDFTLQADSPLIRAAADGASNIGGQRVAVSVSNRDHGNLAGTNVLASPEINTSIANAYELNNGAVEGYVDYIFYNGGLTLANLDLKDVLSFNSDYAGGSTYNKNVSDAEPVTVEYAHLTATTVANTALNLITVTAGAIAVGKHVRVLGQCREVLSKVTDGVNDTLTLSANLLAAVGSNIDVTFGTAQQLAAINPNRLTVLMRTRSNAAAPSIPLVDGEWDNELDAAYGVAGKFFNQEINAKPGLIIDGSTVYGAGDSSAPTGIAVTELAPQWVGIRVYKRNNYSSKGLPV